MHYRVCVWTLILALLLPDLSAMAQDAIGENISSFFRSGEYSAEETYIGNAGVRRGNRAVLDFDESDSLLRFILTPRTKIGVLRIGAEWERFEFGFVKHAPLPDTLQSIGFVLGLDTQFSDSILVRIEGQPGAYNTGFGHVSDDFNMPRPVGAGHDGAPLARRGGHR